MVGGFPTSKQNVVGNSTMNLQKFNEGWKIVASHTSIAVMSMARWNAAYHERIHRDQSNLIPLDPEAFIEKALELLASDRYLEKGMGPHGLTGRRRAEIFFSASFSLPREKLPYPALFFDGQLKTRQAPGTSFEPYLIPVLADPKKLVQALDTLRSLKSFPSAGAVNTTTGPQLPKYVSAAFGSLDLPWKPGHLRSAYGAICCHRFKPKNQADDIFLAQSSVINYSGQIRLFQVQPSTSPRLVAPETRRQALVSSARVPVENPLAQRMQYHD